MAGRLAKSALRFKGMQKIVRYDPDGCYVASPLSALTPYVIEYKS
jgi:hypothetical protein